MYSIIIVIKMSQLLSSQYTLVLIHDSNLNISQVAVYPVCQLRAVQNSLAICFIHHAESENNPLEKCMFVCHYNTGYASTH